MVARASKIAGQEIHRSPRTSQELGLTLPRLQRENMDLREQAVSILLEMFALRERPDAHSSVIGRSDCPGTIVEFVLRGAS